MGISLSNEFLKEIFDRVQNNGTAMFVDKEVRMMKDEIGEHEITNKYIMEKFGTEWSATWIRIDNCTTVFGSEYTNPENHLLYHGDLLGFVKFLLRFRGMLNSEYEFLN